MTFRFLEARKEELRDIYSPRGDMSKGRLITLGDSLITSFYNVFITGIFYTGFLSIYGISITDVGILTFVPYIANCFSLLSPMVLARFKRRKGVLIASKLLFYFLFIVATTVMPLFVTDAGARIRWFVALVFVAHAMYAMFSPGFTTWFYRFYPPENDRRMRFFMYNQMFSSVMSSLVLLTSSLIADALSGSPHQPQLIIGLRYFGFALVVADVAIQSLAKEFPNPKSAALRFREIFTLPFQNRKFVMCLALMFAWNFIANLNNGLWSYHLLNHMDFSYTLINTMAVIYTPMFFVLQGPWRKVIRRYSWVKTFGLCCLFFVPSEISFFLLNPHSTWLYVPTCLYQHIFSVGINLSYANILYINLPNEDNTAHIALYSVGCNAFAFFGLMIGTWMSSISGDNTFPLLGMSIYSMQYTILARAVLLALGGAVLARLWRLFESDENIRLVEDIASLPGAGLHRRLMIEGFRRKMRYYAQRALKKDDHAR